MAAITETNRIQFVLLGRQNRTYLGPYWATTHRTYIPVMMNAKGLPVGHSPASLGNLFSERWR
jgi:hypothetical protein